MLFSVSASANSRKKKRRSMGMVFRVSAEIPLVLSAHQIERDDDCACPDKAFVLSFDCSSIDLDNDCACPDKAFALKPLEAHGTVFIQTPGAYTAQLTHNFHLAFSPYAPAGPSVLNPAAWERWQSFVSSRPLTQDIDRA